MKLLSPKVTMFAQVLPSGRNEAESKRTVLNRGIYTTDTINDATCPITVAIAAPFTPMLNIKIKTGSRITFITAPIMIWWHVLILYFAWDGSII